MARSQAASASSPEAVSQAWKSGRGRRGRRPRPSWEGPRFAFCRLRQSRCRRLDARRLLLQTLRAMPARDLAAAICCGAWASCLSSHTGVVIKKGSAFDTRLRSGQKANPAPTASSKAAAAPTGSAQFGHLPGAVRGVAVRPAGLRLPPPRQADRPGGRYGPELPGKASIHCVPEMNNSSDGAGSDVGEPDDKITHKWLCFVTDSSRIAPHQHAHHPRTPRRRPRCWWRR